MKIILYIISFIIIFPALLLSQNRYDVDPHRYVVSEAWEYLKLKKPEINWNNTPMASAINGNLSNDSCGDGNDPWHIGDVRIGACREDIEDPVYLNHWPFTTATHFWKADEGDNWRMPIALFGDFANAYTKAKAYLYSRSEGKKIFFENLGNYENQISLGYFYYYDNLFDFYNTGHCYFWGYMNLNHDPVQVWEPWHEVYMDIGTARQYSYIILGRVAHLLTDMSVPVHARGITHEGGDNYEVYVDGHFTMWDRTLHSHVSGLGQAYFGPEDIINVAGKQNPLKYLFYITNQIADRFPVDANSQNFPGNTTYVAISGNDNYGLYLTPIYASISTYPGHLAMNEYKADYCFNFSIKAVASLLYWFACNTNQFPPPPPSNLAITSNMIGNPVIGYDLYKQQNGLLYGTAQGSNLTYKWRYFLCSSTNPGYWPLNNYGLQIISQPISQFFTIQNTNFQGETCPDNNMAVLPGSLYLFPQLEVFNIYNGNHQTIWSSPLKITPHTILSGGGCPYLFVLSTDTSGSNKYFAENNVLHRSEFSDFANQYITDVYHLQNIPAIENNKISLQLMETEHDVNYFDQIKLFAIDHPIGTKVGITEANDVILYYSDYVSSTDDAIKNNPNNNITDAIQYNQLYPKIRGSANDYIYAHYDSNLQKTFHKAFKEKLKTLNLKSTIDSLAIIGQIEADAYIGVNSTAKDWAGNITITANSDIYNKIFAKRVKGSEVIIPFSQSNDNVDHVDINYNSDYAMTFISVVPIMYDGFTTTEFPLVEANHTLWGNVLMFLQDIDERSVIIDTSSILDLKFDELSKPTSGLIRDFVLQINGKYTTQEQSINTNYRPLVSNSRVDNKIDSIDYKYKLHNNYPNPFNPITKIKFGLAKSGIAKLEVYDILGRLVRTLVNEYKEAGNYLIDFDGSNLSSGVYIYRLESNNFIESKKMFLIK